MKSHRNIGLKIFLKALLASVALISGGIIYLLFRPSEVIFTGLINKSVYAENLQEIGSNFQSLQNELPDWLMYSLSDGLWAFAYALLISILWSGHSSKFRKYWLLSIPMFTIGLEFLQLIGLLPGTFCLIDLCFVVTGISAGYLIGSNKLKIFNYEN